MGKRTGLNLHLSRKVFIKGLKITSPSFRSASHWEAGSGHGKGEGAARALFWQKPLLYLKNGSPDSTSLQLGLLCLLAPRFQGNKVPDKSNTGWRVVLS